MSKADTVTKDYMSETDVFADIFNYYVYGGKQVILPEQLTEWNTAKISLPYGKVGEAVPIQRFRDVQKLYAAMTDGKVTYVLCGVESQAEVHYAMAVKNNLYDALDYAMQVEEKARLHRRARAQENERRNEAGIPDKRPNSGEFLSGFWKEDRLIPSITVTVYFGSEEWDGPLSLVEMMDVTDPRILSCMDDYHVRLIAPALMSDNEIMQFQSSLREVMLFLKYAKDKEKLAEILKTNESRFRKVERRAVDVIRAMTNTGMKYEEKEKVVDVCQAIQEMQKEAELIGEQKGEQRGEQKGALKEAQKNVRNLYNRMGLSVEKIAEGLEYDVDTVKEWLNL